MLAFVASVGSQEEEAGHLILAQELRISQQLPLHVLKTPEMSRHCMKNMKNRMRIG